MLWMMNPQVSKHKLFATYAPATVVTPICSSALLCVALCNAICKPKNMNVDSSVIRNYIDGIFLTLFVSRLHVATVAVKLCC
jgi:hypothetical protein